MLKLLVFLACEKVIIDKAEMASLINVLDSVTVGPDGQRDLTADAASPLHWEVFAIWRKTDDLVSNKKYEQKIVLKGVDKKIIFEAVQPITTDNTHWNYRSQLMVGAMPIGRKGTLSLKMYLREITPNSNWQEKGEYPLQIIHAKPETAKVSRSAKKKK